MSSLKKYGFTLIEILISISIFSIVIIFLYQTLDMTQKSNLFYSKKLTNKQNQNNIKKIFFLDLIHKSKNITTKLDKENNTIVTLQTTNTYHNPFYTNITYLVSREKNLLRIESKTKFNQSKLNDLFFDTSYIDTLDSNITTFKILEQKNKKIAIYIEKEKQEKVIFSF